jgi:hypothetical protein
MADLLEPAVALLERAAGFATGLEHIHMPNYEALAFDTVWEFGDRHYNLPA